MRRDLGPPVSLGPMLCGCGFGRDAVWTASLVAQYVVDAYDPHNFNQLKARCTIAGFCNPVVDRIFL